MGMIAVLVAAAVAYAFGAIWYMMMAKPWMAAAGLTEESIDRKNPKPYIISAVSVILVAGMMRHIFASSGVDTLLYGVMSGFGLGLFITLPWIATNYGFAGRPMALTLIDGTYAVVGSTLIGIVLVLF